MSVSGRPIPKPYRRFLESLSDIPAKWNAARPDKKLLMIKRKKKFLLPKSSCCDDLVREGTVQTFANLLYCVKKSTSKTLFEVTEKESNFSYRKESSFSYRKSRVQFGTSDSLWQETVPVLKKLAGKASSNQPQNAKKQGKSFLIEKKFCHRRTK